MLFLGLLTFLVAIPLFSYSISASLFSRITSLLLLFSALLAFNGYYVESVASGVGIYSGLFQVTQLSLGMEAFLLVTGSLLLLSWAPVSSTSVSATYQPGKTTEGSVLVSEYSLLILFTTMGASFLVSSSDLISMYLSIELQSFAVYVLATLYRTSESATSAGLKYFLLGGLSSALILLGTAIIYSYTGLTQFESIYSLSQASVASSVVNSGSFIGGEQAEVMVPVFLGLLLIGVGFLFKVAAAPFHNWAPDVYDGVPTVVTSWLTTMPKISIFLFLLELQTGFSSLDFLPENVSILSSTDYNNSGNVWKNLLLTTSLLSLLIGTVVGLSQYRIKRLFAYSTISHVGFLLLCLAIQTEDSVEALLFYLIQYSLTNVCTFLILLAFGYSMYTSSLSPYLQSADNDKDQTRPYNPVAFTKEASRNSDVTFIKELAGQFQANPLLSISLALCLFSMAGIPPLVGFFAKQMVLYSSIHTGYYFLSIVAILVSVISASYYLKIVRVLYFDTNASSKQSNVTVQEGNGITNVHSLVIAILTMFLPFFILHPTILLNSCHLMALSLFTY